MNPANPSKVLVVDDDPTFADFTRMMLESLGFLVTVTFDSTQAVTIAVSEKPDVILMDISMPRLNGIEVTEKLKNDPRTKPIPIILCSLTKSAEEFAAAKQSGVSDFISKPIKLEVLRERLDKILGPR